MKKYFTVCMLCALFVVGCGGSSSNNTPADPIMRLFYYVPDLGGTGDKSKQVVEPDHQMYSATSSDGINFVQEAGVRFSRAQITDPDVFMAKEGQYVMFSAAGASIIKATSETANGTYVEDPAFVWDNGAVCSTVAIEGTLVTFYCSAGTDAIGYAFYDPTTGILTQQGDALPNPFGTGLICDPTVIRLDDGTYVMYYKHRPEGAGEGPLADTIYAATSTDGLNYTGSTMIKEQASVPGALKIGNTIYLYYVDGTLNSTSVGISTDEGATFEFQEIAISDAAGSNAWDPNPIPY